MSPRTQSQPSPVHTTLRDAEPWTPEQGAAEARKWAEEFIEHRLPDVFFFAIRDEAFRVRLCEQLARYADIYGCTASLREALLKPTPGRPQRWTTALLTQLFAEYASFLLDQTRPVRKVTKNDALEALRRLHPDVKTNGAMDNLLTEAVKQVPLENLPPWARPVASSRIKQAQRKPAKPSSKPT